jgi:hypothetical protein
MTGTFQEGQAITIHAPDGTPIALGPKMENNLYKLTLKPSKGTAQGKQEHVFTATELPNWETWHRKLEHVRYPTLTKMLSRDMVNGLHVNEQSPKPTCIPCIEAKHSKHTFPTSNTKCTTTPGELTHMDL